MRALKVKYKISAPYDVNNNNTSYGNFRNTINQSLPHE